MKISKTERRYPLQRRLLQAAIAIGGLVPVSAGLAGIIMGTSMIDGPGRFFAPFDSHYRYLSGLLFAIGLGFWSCIPRIEKRSERFYMLTTIVVIGGLARLVSVFVLGPPDTPMLFGLGMELIVTPLLAVWQYRLARSGRS